MLVAVQQLLVAARAAERPLLVAVRLVLAPVHRLLAGRLDVALVVPLATRDPQEAQSAAAAAAAAALAFVFAARHIRVRSRWWCGWLQRGGGGVCKDAVDAA